MGPSIPGRLIGSPFPLVSSSLSCVSPRFPILSREQLSWRHGAPSRPTQTKRSKPTAFLERGGCGSLGAPQGTASPPTELTLSGTLRLSHLAPAQTSWGIKVEELTFALSHFVLLKLSQSVIFRDPSQSGISSKCVDLHNSVSLAVATSNAQAVGAHIRVNSRDRAMQSHSRGPVPHLLTAFHQEALV